MICSSLCRVPFMAVLLSWVWENSHSRRSSFRGLRQRPSHAEIWPRLSPNVVRHLCLLKGAAVISHFFRPAVGKGKRVVWNLCPVQCACSRGLLSCAEDRRLAGVAERCVYNQYTPFFTNKTRHQIRRLLG